jgi:hypothetical protein
MAEETVVRGQKAIEQTVDVPLQQAFPNRSDMAWLRIERPSVPKPVPGPKGMRLRDVENEHTRQVPDVWPFLNDHPRGAIPTDLPVISAGYSIFDKISVWSDNCIDLYEDAIYDRWSSANSIPWATITPLPEVTEAAIDQICTELSEQAYLDVQVLSSWLEKISYGFKEVKNFLATQIFDRSRHTEAFRKRALANGGGLGIEGPGIYHRAILGAMRFPDLALALFVRAVWTRSVCEAVAAHARIEVDRTLFSLVSRDLDRHIAYVTGLLRHTLCKDPAQARTLHATLTRHELLFVSEMTRDSSFSEALVLALSDDPQQGNILLEETRRAAVRRYVSLLDDAGLTGRPEKLQPALKALLETEAAGNRQ